MAVGLSLLLGLPAAYSISRYAQKRLAIFILSLSFIFSWNNFMFSQVLSMERTKTLPIAVYNFLSYAEVDWGGVMAAAVAIMAPAIVLTMIFQKYVVKGLTMGAVKG